MTKEPKVCLVCGALLESTSRYPGLLKCSACGFLTADIDVSEEELAAIYGEDYFHGEEYLDYVQERSALQLNFARRLNEIKSLSGVSAKTKLYEIGCAYGFFLEIAQREFAMCSGIDISDDAVSYARDTIEVDAQAGDFLKTELPFTPDVVCMWDVIEHLKYPQDVVKKAAEGMAPGGYMCITTGDIGSIVARLRGPKWRMIHPPTHLHYFSKDTLSMLVENCGLEVAHVGYPSVIRTIGTMLHGVIELRLGAKKLAGALSRLPGQSIAIPINLFDIMFLVARKPR